MKRKRTERRAAAREAVKLTRDLERLAQHATGGAPERPIMIVTPSELEVHVASTRCPLCEGPLELEEHAAETIGTRRLRLARVKCRACGSRRTLYFQLAQAN
jgi:hypothetical protein